MKPHTWHAHMKTKRLKWLQMGYRPRLQRLHMRLAFMTAVCLLFVVLNLVTTLTNNHSSHNHNRHLLSELSLMAEIDGLGCGHDSDSTSVMGPGGIPIWIIGVIYTFFGLAIVCDDYFVDSLERISMALDLSDDVAGATFMAAGSSAPELFTSLIGVFFTDPAENPGPGTIVGSAVFNITVIIGVTALSAKEVLDLDWWPLCRDSAYYSLSIILLILAFKTGTTDTDTIEWWEGLYLWVAYLGYIAIMKYNSRIVEFINARREGKIKSEHEKMTRSNMDGDAPLPYQRFRGMNPRFRSIYRQGVEAVNRWQEEERRRKESEPEVEVQKIKFKSAGKAVIVSNQFADVAERAKDEDEQKHEDETDAEEEEQPPLSSKEKFLTIISWPWLFLFRWTIPNSAKTKWADYYMLTFCMSMVWIMIISFFMVDFAGKLGQCILIPGPVMGLTLLAAGTSVPDTFSSVLVARDGKGDMAVSNAIGSNVFDILLGLGFPWFLYTLSKEANPLCINTGGIVVYTIILFCVLIGFVGVLYWQEFKLEKGVGYFLFVIYFFFVIYGLLDAYVIKSAEDNQDFVKCICQSNPDNPICSDWEG